MNKDILKYESKVWATADLLLGAGIKQSDFPKFMMPFFALIMVESRFLRMGDELKKELEDSGDVLENWEFVDEVKDKEQGYNQYLFEKNISLADICKNDKTFDLDFNNYLLGFDAETQDLLGVNKSNNEEKYLDISGVSGLLNKKKILFAFVKAWSEIDLRPFNNSQITTLEEHIKRKWADISAETAGEQYTPDDVISLISEIIVSKIESSDEFLTIYDPTCGGGNMLYGVEDRINRKFYNRPTATYGQDWNDALYALAKIESRFRKNSYIEYGNTLVDTKYDEKEFDVVVANPPYGVDWKGYKSDILKDKTGRFHDLPAVSDGQLLFMQHLISKMNLKGMGVVVHNGSTLFSGDAGSGESNIRKWMFEQDIVEAIIQLPTDEFFNTNIYTYLWVLNKDKKSEHKDKVMLINASDKFELLKKNKGKKRKKIDKQSRKDIVDTLTKFKDNDYALTFPKEYFYFNKQAIRLTNLDYRDKTIESIMSKNEKSVKFNFTKIVQDDILIDSSKITEFDSEKYFDLQDYHENFIKPIIKELDYKQKDLKVYFGNVSWWYDEDKETIIKQEDEKIVELGCGKIVIRSSFKKATKTMPEKIEITFELTPDYQKDYEIIPYSKDKKQNQKNIENFMVKYVTKPFIYLDNVVGIEINFNKVFYKPEKLRPLEDIVKDIDSIDEELTKLKDELGL
jgi:type I restriction enzyme M protein